METLIALAGDYEISLLDTSGFALDGGAMFGPVPKPLWERRIAPDSRNRIPLACRAIIGRPASGSKTKGSFMIDVGMGNSWSNKERDIFAVDPLPISDWPEVDSLIITHLHFDHAGALMQRGEDGNLHRTFPEIPLYVQQANIDTALTPLLKEAGSYRPELVVAITTGNVIPTNGTQEICANVTAYRSDGHTTGLQWLAIGAQSGELVIFPSDLIPTSHHIHPAYHTAYDICPKTGVEEKRVVLTLATERHALLIFQHDPEIAAARVENDGKGWYRIIPESVVPHPRRAS